MTKSPPPKLKIGVDEVGRAGIAGPLIVCGLYHPEPARLLRMGAMDSKVTDREHREKFMRRLHDEGRAIWCLSVAEPYWINRAGLTTSEAQRVLSVVTDMASKLGVSVDQLFLYGDGDKQYPNLPRRLERKFAPKADSTEPLVSAASIVARHKRDELMDALAAQYPDWYFHTHGGANTLFHVEMLYRHGPLDGVHWHKAAAKAVIKYATRRHLPVPDWALKVRPPR